MRSFGLSWILAAFVGALALGGCSSDDGGAPADGADACTGRACADTGGGGGGGGGGTDASGDVGDPPTACTTDADCPDGTACDAGVGVCVPLCGTDADCAPTEACGADGRCAPRTACTDDSACAGGEACDVCLGVCVTADAGATVCSMDANCSFEEFCDPCIGRCQPRLELCDPCTDDAQCGDGGDLCLDYAAGGRFCGQGCGACPVGYTCDPSSSQCVAISGDCGGVRECDEPADCPAGETCLPTFVCGPGCTENEACPGDEVCQAGTCSAPCTTDADCPAGGECGDDGICRVPGGCLTSADCPEAETYCDRDTLQCVPGCETNNDCLDSSLECVAGSCVRRPCRGNWACAFGEVCDLDAGECVEAEGPYCDACNGDDIDSCGTENACLSFEDDDGGDAGAFCLVACAEEGDNACPQGYGCEELDLGDQGIRRVCARQCPRDPV